MSSNVTSPKNITELNRDVVDELQQMLKRRKCNNLRTKRLIGARKNLPIHKKNEVVNKIFITEQPSIRNLKSGNETVQKITTSEQPSIHNLKSENETVQKITTSEQPSIRNLKSENETVQKITTSEQPSIRNLKSENETVQKITTSEQPSIRNLKSENETVQEIVIPKQLSVYNDNEKELENQVVMEVPQQQFVCNGSEKLNNQSEKEILTPQQLTFRDRNRKLRYQTVNEILTSEQSYESQLELLLTFFICPLMEKKLIDEPLFTKLAGDLQMFRNLSHLVIKKLILNPYEVPNLFLKLIPFFKIYSIYACYYEDLLRILMTAQQKDERVKNFISAQETRPEVGRKLSSLLIIPIQRIPRYKLLLRELSQYMSFDDKEYSSVKDCLMEIDKVAKHMDRLINDYDRVRELLKLQRCLKGNFILLAPGRILIKHGHLTKISSKGNGNQKRYFILLSDILVYCKGSPNSSLYLRALFPLHKCEVEYTKSSGILRISCLNESLLFHYETNNWFEVIQNMIEKCKNDRRTLQKISSSRIPLRFDAINQLKEGKKLKCEKRKFNDSRTEVCDGSENVYNENENHPTCSKKIKLNYLTKSKSSNSRKLKQQSFQIETKDVELLKQPPVSPSSSSSSRNSFISNLITSVSTRVKDFFTSM